MNGCEFFEVEISALVDGELSGAASLRTIDHLMECCECRQFYGSARAVEDLVAQSEIEGRSESLPGRLWSGIEKTAHGPETEAPGQVRRSVPTWALKAAAVAVLAVGAAVIVAVMMLQPRADDSDMVIQLEGRPGSMTDTRFLQIATEDLQADRQYHMKMQQIMTAVNRHSFAIEGPQENGLAVEGLGGELRRVSSDDQSEPDPSAEIWY